MRTWDSGDMQHAHNMTGRIQNQMVKGKMSVVRGPRCERCLHHALLGRGPDDLCRALPPDDPVALRVMRVFATTSDPDRQQPTVRIEWNDPRHGQTVVAADTYAVATGRFIWPYRYDKQYLTECSLFKKAVSQSAAEDEAESLA